MRDSDRMNSFTLERSSRKDFTSLETKIDSRNRRVPSSNLRYFGTKIMSIIGYWQIQWDNIDRIVSICKLYGRGRPSASDQGAKEGELQSIPIRHLRRNWRVFVLPNRNWSLYQDRWIRTGSDKKALRELRTAEQA